MKQKPKELDWELNKEQKDWLLDVLNTNSDNALKVILINGLISKTLTQQRTELLKTIDTELEVDLKGKTNEPDSEYDEGWNDACLEWDLLLNKTIDRIKRGVFDKNTNLLNKKYETK